MFLSVILPDTITCVKTTIARYGVRKLWQTSHRIDTFRPRNPVTKIMQRVLLPFEFCRVLVDFCPISASAPSLLGCALNSAVQCSFPRLRYSMMTTRGDLRPAPAKFWCKNASHRPVGLSCPHNPPCTPKKSPQRTSFLSKLAKTIRSDFEPESV